MKWVNRGHEFDHLKEFDFESKHYAIWGAGTYGLAFYESMKDKLNFVSFIDRSKEKIGGKIGDISIKSPEQFLSDRTDEIVVVSTGLTRSVYSVLNDNGYVRYRDYFHIDELEALYMYFKYDKVCISDLPMCITECCTLHCEYCNAFIPQIEKPRNFTIESIMADLNCALDWIDEINVLGLVGGDAMVHPQFAKILYLIGEKYYPKRIHSIEVYSNAVIIPREEVLDLFKRFNVFYRFTDYSGQSGKQNISEVIDALKNKGIRYDHARLESWYDSGYPQKDNGIHTEEGLCKFCDACDRKTCHSIRDKKFYTCAMCVNADVIGYCPIEDTDYFDMSVYDNTQRTAFIEYYLGYSTKGYYSYCRKCNGGMNVNTHVIPVGKQIY